MKTLLMLDTFLVQPSCIDLKPTPPDRLESRNGQAPLEERLLSFFFHRMIDGVDDDMERKFATFAFIAFNASIVVFDNSKG